MTTSANDRLFLIRSVKCKGYEKNETFSYRFDTD